MRRGIALPALVIAAVLVVWHGVILSLPHTHTDRNVPQEAISCTASQAGSHDVHLHHRGRAMAAHPCLACLAGSTIAEMPCAVPFMQDVATGTRQQSAWKDHRSGTHAQLPDPRAPPC